jgi:hypothetical protein
MFGRMKVTFDWREHPGPWGGRQPKFEHLEYDEPGRFFLVHRSPTGEPVRVQLIPPEPPRRPPSR